MGSGVNVGYIGHSLARGGERCKCRVCRAQLGLGGEWCKCRIYKAQLGLGGGEV